MARTAKQVLARDVKSVLETGFKDAVEKLKSKITNAKEITAALKIIIATKKSILSQI